MRMFSITGFAVAGTALLAMDAHAALISTDGGLGVYDTTNNVTWTSDANLMATQASQYSGGSTAYVSAVIAASGGVVHDTPGAPYDPTGTYTLSVNDFNTSLGTMNWWGAQAWVNYLNVTNYGGSNQWALPVAQNYNIGPSPSSGQLAQLFYDGLGQVKYSPITTTHNSNYALFSNVQNGYYWSGTEETSGLGAYYFYTGGGWQDYADIKTFNYYAMAVSPGEVNAVPLPGAAWLLGSGLLWLLGLSHRKLESRKPQHGRLG